MIISRLVQSFLTEQSLQNIFLFSQGEEGKVQYGYWKWGTNAQVFSETLPHLNSKNQINQRNREEERNEYMLRSTAGNKKKKL